MPNQDVSAVQRGQEYFRLKRVVQSAGDIFELDESALEVYIGPDSDIAEVEMTYFNPDEPLSLETATVSVNGPFVGRVDSLPKTLVSSTNQPARILLSPTDIVDNAYAPPISLAFRRFNIPALIDVIIAVKRLTGIPAVRADRTLRFPQVPYEGQAVVPLTDNGSTDLIVPIYGRRMATVTVISRFSVEMSLSLVTLLPGSPTIPRGLGSITTPQTIPPVLFTKASVIRASDANRHGLVYNVAGGGPPFAISSMYVEGDQPDDQPSTATPQVRGMADLLLINIRNAGIAIPGTRFADVFIKISDRET